MMLNSVDILENLCRISAQCLKAVSLQNKAELCPFQLHDHEIFRLSH